MEQVRTKTYTRRRKHHFGLVAASAVPIGAGIGCMDVLEWESTWPVGVAMFLAAFILTVLIPTRWLSIASTLTFMVWCAYAWVRIPWWDHPEEVGQHAYSVVLVAVCAFFGAFFAARIQLARGKL